MKFWDELQDEIYTELECFRFGYRGTAWAAAAVVVAGVVLLLL